LLWRRASPPATASHRLKPRSTEERCPRLLAIREEAIRFELITAAGAGTAIFAKNVFRARRPARMFFAFRGDPDDTKNRRHPDARMDDVGGFSFTGWPHQCAWRPHIGNQSRFHVIKRASPSGVYWPSARKIAIITGFNRNMVPSASRYSLHLSLASSISISVVLLRGIGSDIAQWSLQFPCARGCGLLALAGQPAATRLIGD